MSGGISMLVTGTSKFPKVTWGFIPLTPLIEFDLLNTTLLKWKFAPKLKWIVLFAHADWLAPRWLAKYYSPPSSQKMASHFALVSEKEIISVNKEAVPTDTKMATKFVYSWHSKYPSLLIIEWGFCDIQKNRGRG